MTPDRWLIRTTAVLLVILAIAASFTIGADTSPEVSFERASGIELPFTETVAKGLPDKVYAHQLDLNRRVGGLGPLDGCSITGDNPYRYGSTLSSDHRLTCMHNNGYRIVSIRTVGRLYARMATWRDWHRYSRDATIVTHQRDGEAWTKIRDACHLGEGMNWYQARYVSTVTWHDPRSNTVGTGHFYRRWVSGSRLDCSGGE
jgi:hypothetical protein